MKFSCLIALLIPVLAFSQNAPSGGPAGNGIKNGNFELFNYQPNLWAGLDGSGYLAGYVQDVDAVLEAGSMGRLRLPCSVQVADINGDGLLDIFTVDGYGYFRVYFNSGTKTEPKFTTCEIVPLFMRRVMPVNTIPVENGFHACLADFSNRGLLDILVGDYTGRLLFIKNTGLSNVPEWRQPAKTEDLILPTTRDGHLWANLLAPVVCDWNGDGKPDIIMGEGSYSANSVHLMLNNGTITAPKFDESGHEYLAYGEGREQLVPAVVDWNGDGNNDLLVGDRMGNINLYLAKAPWTKGTQLELQADPVKFGTETCVGKGNPGAKCVSPAVADLNGDGLFDIVFGETNGRVAVAYNIGTKTEPKFGPPVELKGENASTQPSLNLPKYWEISFGIKEGNFYSYHTCINPADDPDAAGSTSQRVLKFGYSPSLNKIIRRQPMILPSLTKKTDVKVDLYGASFQPNGSAGVNYTWMERTAYDVESNTAILRQLIDPGFLKPLSNFKLSFKVKGRGVRNGKLRFWMGGWLIHDTKKDGNAAGNWVSEAVTQDDDFSVNSTWSVVSKTISARFVKEPDLNKPERWAAAGKVEYRGMLEIRSTVEPDTGVLYIDDVQLTPQ